MNRTGMVMVLALVVLRGHGHVDGLGLGYGQKNSYVVVTMVLVIRTRQSWPHGIGHSILTVLVMAKVVVSSLGHHPQTCSM